MVKIILVAVVLAIYFMVLKPNYIRQECEKSARQEAIMEITTEVESNENRRKIMQADYEELALKKCLKEGGVK